MSVCACLPISAGQWCILPANKTVVVKPIYILFYVVAEIKQQGSYLWEEERGYVYVGRNKGRKKYLHINRFELKWPLFCNTTSDGDGQGKWTTKSGGIDATGTKKCTQSNAKMIE